MTRRERVMVRVGTGIVLSLLVLRALPGAFRAHADRKERVNALRDQVSQSRRLIEAIPALSAAQASATTGLTALRARALTAASSDEAVAQLASRLTTIAEECGIRMDRTDVAADSVQPGLLVPIGVRVLVEGDTEGLMTFLAAVESDSIAQRAGQIEISATDPGSDAARPEVLRAEMTIHAWWMLP